MPNQVTKVIYKPDPQSTDEYTVIVNPEEYKKWKEGDTTIPLVNVVDAFHIYFSNQGSQGQLGQASKQQLENIFQTAKVEEAIVKLLENGTMQGSKAIAGGSVATNAVHGSQTIDVRGGPRTSGAGYGR